MARFTLSSPAAAPGLPAPGRRPATMERSLLLAHIISLVCLPPLLATGTLIALSSHYVADRGQAARVAFVSSFFLAIAPSAYVGYLLKRHKISGGVYLSLREERWRIYLVSTGSCVLGLVALLWLHAPQLMTVLALCYAVNTLVLGVITQRWKISAHAAGVAVPLTALLNAFGAAALPLGVIVPAVCWARVRTQMHTVGQVCAGALLGFVLTWLQLALLAPPF